jgi:hypothetical protein
LCITDERQFADGECTVAAAKAGWQELARVNNKDKKLPLIVSDNNIIIA